MIKLDSLIALSQDVQQDFQDTKTRLTVIQPDIRQTMGAVRQIEDRLSITVPALKQIENVAQAIEKGVETSRVELLNASRQGDSAIEALVQRENQQLKIEIASLRDVVL